MSENRSIATQWRPLLAAVVTVSLGSSVVLAVSPEPEPPAEATLAEQQAEEAGQQPAAEQASPEVTEETGPISEEDAAELLAEFAEACGAGAAAPDVTGLTEDEAEAQVDAQVEACVAARQAQPQSEPIPPEDAGGAGGTIEGGQAGAAAETDDAADSDDDEDADEVSEDADDDEEGDEDESGDDDED